MRSNSCPAVHSSLRDFLAASPASEHSLRLLTLNMQVGIRTRGYHDYLLKSWQHLLPCAHRQQALVDIAELIRPFDIVALQEADAGSWRSRRINQVEHLAQLAGFPHWYQQVNRNLGALAQHSNGLLSRLPVQQLNRYALPGALPGRGLMIAQLPLHNQLVTVAVTHLALGKRTQFAQLDFLVSQVAGAEHLIIMGDLNQEADVLLQHSPLKQLRLQPLTQALPTYPSWRPLRGLDHIFVSEQLVLERLATLKHPLSDHLPVAAAIRLAST